MATSSSMTKAMGWPSQRGAYSDTNSAAPSAMGVAITSAMMDVTMVPKMNGRAPNATGLTSVSTGFQSDENKERSAELQDGFS